MSDQNIRSHAAHPSRSVETSLPPDFPRAERPANLLHVDTESVRVMLEQLDDVIFSAIQGDEDSLEQARELWPQIVVEIGWDMVEESREQYLRYAIDVTRSLETSEDRYPERALAALEVISLLTKN